MKSSLLVAGLVASVVACSAPGSSDPRGPRLGAVSSPVVNGTTSGTDLDSVVMITMQGTFCTATFIAPDLVITAHHCVAGENTNATSACAPLGKLIDASEFEVKLNQPGGGTTTDGEGTTKSSPSVARGTRVWVTPTNNICSFDVALIKLDRKVPNAKISNLRFSALAKNEPVVTAGFGDDGQGNYPNARRQRSTTVLGVGPTTVQFESESDGTIPLSLPKGDVMTGESHCFGDSGGPLFDKSGNIVAIVSRGPDDAPQNVGSRGEENCIDMAETYAGIAFHEAFIRQAVKEAGHELTTGPIGSTQGSGGGDATAGDDDDDTAGTQSKPTDTGEEDDDDASGDDDDDTSSSSTSKKKKTTGASTQPAAATCSAVPGGTAGDRGALFSLVGLGVAMVPVFRRRRSSRG